MGSLRGGRDHFNLMGFNGLRLGRTCGIKLCAYVRAAGGIANNERQRGGRWDEVLRVRVETCSTAGPMALVIERGKSWRDEMCFATRNLLLDPREGSSLSWFPAPYGWPIRSA